MKDKKKEYKARVICRNCEWRGKIVIKFGVCVMMAECPNCGIANLEPINGRPGY